MRCQVLIGDVPLPFVSLRGQVGPQPLLQIFLFCGFIEFMSHKGKMTLVDMFADGTREPGTSWYIMPVLCLVLLR